MECSCKDGGYCDKVNQYITDGFCKIVCKGNYDVFRQPSVDERRAENREPLDSQNMDMVSVIIPCGMFDKQYLEKTIQSVRDNAVGPIEVIVEMDTYDEGHRVLTNRGAGKAQGKYILRLDAHCAMSYEWDARMKLSCKSNVIVKPMLDGLNPETWTGKNRDMGMVVWDKKMRNCYPFFWRTIPQRKIEEESLSMIGCCFMLRKDYYEKLGGCDESLSKWGGFGLEWSLKTWLTGGRVLIRTDTVCYHLFRKDGSTPYTVDNLDETYLELGRTWRFGRGNGQTRPLAWLISRFHKYLKSAVVRPTREQRESARRDTVDAL